MKYATVITISEGNSENRGDFFHFGSTYISAPYGVGGLMHVAINDVCDMELTVKVLW
jgi:hypothetical protein